jgi:hypothetical protein
MKKIGIMIVAILALLFLNSNADEITKDQKLRKLAELENLIQIVQNHKAECIKGMKDFDPNIVIKTQPNFFGGIMPGSKKWKEVEEAFRKYINSYCSCLDEKEVVEEFVRIYRGTISEETLDSVLNFYSSPSGIKYLEATNIGNIKLQEYYSKAFSEKLKIAVKEYYDSLQNIYDSK